MIDKIKQEDQSPNKKDEKTLGVSAASVKVNKKEAERKKQTQPINESKQPEPKSKKKKKKGPRLLRGRAQAHIKTTYNNTIVAITDYNGDVICSSSAGKCGFKAAKKATPYAAGVIVRSLADKIKSFGIKDLDVFIKGVGLGREAAIRAFGVNNLNVNSIKDVTPIPHNGCRPKKPRRV